MMAFEDAQALVLGACEPGETESIAIAQGVGRVLARDIIASDDLVPFARSAMDGYAVRASDLGRLPAVLPVVDSVYAAPGQRQHAPGTATAIATGAAIPSGADSVVRFEDVDLRAGAITVTTPIRPGTYIFPPGDDARRGEVLLGRGTLINAACLGLLAAAGVTEIPVHRRPRVAVICGGDELVDLRELPGHGQVRDSNGVMLWAALTAAGAMVAPPVRLRDDRESIRAALVRACDGADLVVTTGGASVGERDFMKAACREIGTRFLFDSVALRPAKPTAVGRRGDAIVAVLPGNPAAAFVALHEFVAPAVRALGGFTGTDVRMLRVPARLDGSIHAKPGRSFAAFAALRTGPGGFVATPLANQCSSLTRTAVDAAGFIIVPPGAESYQAPDELSVDVFDWGRVGGVPAATFAAAMA